MPTTPTRDELVLAIRQTVAQHYSLTIDDVPVSFQLPQDVAFLGRRLVTELHARDQKMRIIRVNAGITVGELVRRCLGE